MEIINKISPKTCKIKPEMELVEIDGKQVPRAKGEQHLLRIIGVANDLKKGMGEHGPWVAFVGNFEATNVVTGEVFRSSKCFLPESFTGMLAASVADNKDGNVQFAVDVGVKPATTMIGYEFTVKPLLEVSDSDPLTLLKNSLSGIPALPAPKNSEKQEPAADTEKTETKGKKK